MPDAVMLFAAGFGSRMGALTAETPKPLIQVAGRALIDHALKVVQDAGVTRCVVNAHYRAAQIAEHLEGRPGVSLSIEEPKILDTGGGLKHAQALLRADPVYTLNSDAVWTGPNPLLTLRAAWAPERMDALVLLVPHARARGRQGPGDFSCNAEGRVKRGGDLVYTGTQILKTNRVVAHPAEVFSLNAVWDTLAEEGRLYGVVHPGGWADVGHPAGIAEAEAMLREACA